MNALQDAHKLMFEIWADSSKWHVNLEKAETILESALLSDAANINLLTCLGAVLSDRGKHVQAIEILKKAVALNSLNKHTYFNFAVATLNAGSHKEAIGLFSKARKFESSDETWEAYFDPHGH